LAAEVTAKIVALIESGVTPWACPWDRSGLGAMPLRSTGQQYQGINTLILWAEAAEKGYAAKHWFTYKQAAELGGQVRAGQKATTVVYYGSGESKTKTKADGTAERFTFLKAYHVFNADQCDGLPAKFRPDFKPAAPRTWADIADLDAWHAGTGIKTNHGGARAFYRPSDDSVTMPERERFADVADYYGTLFHEDVHATGASHRVGRPRLTLKFGDMAYAIEELVAELGAAFLSAHFGLASEPRADHAAYLASWLGVLKSDPRALFLAAAEAQKAVNWLTKRGEVADVDEALDVAA